MKTAVKERPILFSGPMVRAILDGKKTQTRRVLKPQPPKNAHSCGVCSVHPQLFSFGTGKGNSLKMPPIRCPYGSPRGQLWVRETWAETVTEKARGCIAYAADQSGRLMLCDNHGEGDLVGIDSQCQPDLDGIRWKPSIHMKRAASRLTLEIFSVRVERLQSITEEDAMAEGIHEFKLPNGSIFGHDPKGTPGPMVGGTARESFAILWESINGDGSWDKNPWVWVVSFHRA